MHPVNTFAVKADGVEIGTLSVPHPTVLANIDKKCAVAFFEITTKDFAAVEPAKVKYAEPSKFPGVDIDLTFSVDISKVDLTALTALAKSVCSEYLTDVKVKDIYTADGVTALTLRFSFVSSERTLTKQELGTEKIIEAFAKEGINMK
jgi:phenylalanyl-tRNA synthetase beta chain